jgi:hypothetical protein
VPFSDIFSPLSSVEKEPRDLGAVAARDSPVGRGEIEHAFHAWPHKLSPLHTKQR